MRPLATTSSVRLRRATVSTCTVMGFLRDFSRAATLPPATSRTTIKANQTRRQLLRLGFGMTFWGRGTAAINPENTQHGGGGLQDFDREQGVEVVPALDRAVVWSSRDHVVA